MATRRYDPDGLRLGTLIHPQNGGGVDLNAELRAPLTILNILACSVIAKHILKACWVGVCDRVVAGVDVGLLRLRNLRIHTQQLPRLRVVVAPYQIVRSCSCTVRPVVSGLSNPC